MCLLSGSGAKSAAVRRMRSRRTGSGSIIQHVRGEIRRSMGSRKFVPAPFELRAASILCERLRSDRRRALDQASQTDNAGKTRTKGSDKPGNHTMNGYVDLSTHHQPVSDFVALPTSPPGWDHFRLTEEQVTFFRAHGYVAGIRVLSDGQVEQLRQELRELTDSSHSGHHLFHEYHSNESADPIRCCFTPWVPGGLRRDFTICCGTRPSRSRPASCSRARCDSGTISSFANRPSTAASWPGIKTTRIGPGTQPMQHLTCWIGLDDSTRRKWLPAVYSGSHRWDLLPITGLAGDMEAIRSVLSDEQWEQLQRPVAIELKQGEASFHHPLMVHGS